MKDPTRRDILQAAVAVSLLGAEAPTLAAAPSKAKGAFTYQRVPAPLPFDAKSLKGISEKLIQSHWENNYSGAVKALNAVRVRFTQALNDAELPPYLYNELKREHLVRTGSVVLHEAYFANLGGNGKADAATRTTLASTFGTFDAWETEFRKIGLGLGGGSGWVVLGYNEHLEILENYWLADHATHPPATTPILVMDMYEHAYQMDYGAAAVKYVDAFFANIQWDAVAQRLASSMR